MNLLLLLNDRHPVATGAVGVLAGVGSWFVNTLHLIAQPIADLGLIAGGLTAVLILAVKIRALLRDRRARRWRKKMCRLDPAEDGLDGLS